MDTDTQVLEDVIAELKVSPILHHTQLSVVVEDGIVTISGRANTFEERKAIERAAKRVAGIRRLDLEIRACAFPEARTPATGRLDPDQARDGAMAERLWTVSEELVKGYL